MQPLVSHFFLPPPDQVIRGLLYLIFEQQLLQGDQAIFLAARLDKVAGIARCVDSKGSPLLTPERYCYVTSVYVKPEDRRHGVLSALMATLLAALLVAPPNAASAAGRTC